LVSGTYDYSFSKQLLFDGKSIMNEKERIKGKKAENWF
jgi:hypothetical protein